MPNAMSSSRCRMSCTFGGQLGDAHRELRHVHGAGGAVDERDRAEEEQRRDEAHDDVRDAGADALAGAAEREQHVARRQQDLEPDVEVEEVAGDERVEDARPTGSGSSGGRSTPASRGAGRRRPARRRRRARRAARSPRSASMIADSRSTTSTMPNGASHPPTATTVGSPGVDRDEQHRRDHDDAREHARCSPTICARRWRPRMSADAAPSSGSSTTRGTSAAVIGAPPRRRGRARRCVDARMPRTRGPRRAPRRSRR